MMIVKSIPFYLLFTSLLLSHVIASENETIADIIGTRVVDLTGQIHKLGVKNKAVPIVVVFIGEQCPVSMRYLPELNQFSKLAQSLGLQFYAVISDPHISVTEASVFAAEHDLDFTPLWDPSGDLAARLQPVVTPEAFVISPEGMVLYRGRIDNRFASIGVLRNQITSQDLRDVITRIGKQENVIPRQTEAIGCFIEGWRETLPEQITYNRDIAPIINANCVECHRSGSVAPFPLETYSQVLRRAKMISLVTTEGIMPPWPAARDYGHFRDERYLSNRQIALLSAWEKQGAPLGDPSQALPKPKWPSPDWIGGTPDLIIEMEEAFTIPAGGDDIYRYFVVPVEVLQDQHIVGLEFRPGDPQAVHHSLVYLDYTDRARRKDAEDDEYGFSVFGTGGFMDSSDPNNAVYLGGWAPGIDPLGFPPGHGIPLQGRSGDAVFEIHYRPTGRETSDRSRIGLYFATEPIDSIVASTVAGTVDVYVAPEDKNYWRQVYLDIPADIKLIGVSPHMHYIGKEVKAIATLPDGSTVPLLHIPDWDFRWQNVYMFREPLSLPTGSRIDAWFKFDNSSDNPSNPHIPPGPVQWGWASDEEMCELWMRFTAEDPESIRMVRQAGNRSWSRGANLTSPPPE